MKSLIIAAMLTTLGTAQASQDLATKRGCMACHAVDRKVVGPSFRDVSRKYQNQSPDTVATSIRLGGSGRWGAMPMPPQPQVTEAESRALAQWILNQL